ncbi:MAG: sulfatase [Candidatus Omnitrophica bacterium]|nr:sulfatase [Candidatus Omnitrophota bacterium]
MMKFRNIFILIIAALAAIGQPGFAQNRPNILFALADDWGWPHAGAYGDAVVKTPTFDRLANQGVLFEHAYISSPSCTPSRGAVLTGQFHWRLGGAANLWSVFPDRFATYPEILEQNGYFVGSTGKTWGPGKTETPGRQLAGKRYKDFDEFLLQRDKEKPFCFWLGSGDPHRPYEEGTGIESGMDLSKIEVPACFPDVPEIRSDIADYYFEVQRFDTLVGEALKSLEQAGELENTIVLMTGDHGFPFPRGKSNLYDIGARVPLAVMWPKGIPKGQTHSGFVSFVDVAPTVLDAAGVSIPKDVSGKSLLGMMTNGEASTEEGRESIVFGKERHVPSQESPDWGGYPSRAIRTHEFLYIHNFTPERWPNGTPDYEHATIPGAWYADTDNGPTKTLIIEKKDSNEDFKRAYDLCFAKRPSEELYDLRKDPDQLVNVAGEEEYADNLKELREQLMETLRETGDQRVLGHPEIYEEEPYLGGAPKFPGWMD